MTDGAAAVILERDRAGAVRVGSIGSATASHAVAERPDPLAFESVRRAGERTFERGGPRLAPVEASETA